jgi:hypothetical protein
MQVRTTVEPIQFAPLDQTPSQDLPAQIPDEIGPRGTLRMLGWVHRRAGLDGDIPSARRRQKMRQTPSNVAIGPSCRYAAVSNNTYSQDGYVVGGL